MLREDILLLLIYPVLTLILPQLYNKLSNLRLTPLCTPACHHSRWLCHSRPPPSTVPGNKPESREQCSRLQRA